jgi:hypothetical protein
MQAARTSTTLLTHHETRTTRRHQGMRRACSFAMKACNSAMYSSIARYSRMARRSCTRRSSLKSTASCARYSSCDKASISLSVCGILWTFVAVVWACSCNVVCVCGFRGVVVSIRTAGRSATPWTSRTVAARAPHHNSVPLAVFRLRRSGEAAQSDRSIWTMRVTRLPQSKIWLAV